MPCFHLGREQPLRNRSWQEHLPRELPELALSKGRPFPPQNEGPYRLLCQLERQSIHATRSQRPYWRNQCPCILASRTVVIAAGTLDVPAALSVGVCIAGSSEETSVSSRNLGRSSSTDAPRLTALGSTEDEAPGHLGITGTQFFVGFTSPPPDTSLNPFCERRSANQLGIQRQKQYLRERRHWWRRTKDPQMGAG